MLDRLKCLQELEQHLPSFCAEAGSELRRARELFYWLMDRQDLVHSLKAYDTPSLVPLWEGPFNKAVVVNPYNKPYAVVAADGSQVYPDRHRSVPCYLLNSGIVHFSYNQESSAHLFSVPRVYTQSDEPNGSEDMVNCHRTELELEEGLKYSSTVQGDQQETPFLFMVDGSLIFWYLESKPPSLRDRFFKRYIELFEGFYKDSIPYVSYISLPKARDLVTIFKNGTAHALFPGITGPWETIIDADIIDFFLPVGSCSTLFSPRSRLLDLYPPHLRPSCVYVKNDDEIARIEMPAWVAQDEALRTTALSIVYDQCIKGSGYPIALSEAHEQAVVRADEKEFFFAMVSRIGAQHEWHQRHSLKSLKKRYAAV